MATLQEIKNCELDILKAVAEVCDKNDLDYYLASGTLLGSIRNKGFIPWDDDIDIYMKYDDIQKFISVAEKFLPEKFFVQTFDNDPGMGKVFIKVRNKYSYMPEETDGASITYNQGVWIDIFPLMKAGKNLNAVRKQVKYLFKFQRTSSERIHILKTNYRSFPTKCYRILRELLYYRPVSRYSLWKAGKLQSEKSYFYIVLDNYYYGDYSEEKVKTVLKHRIETFLTDNKSKYLFEDNYFTGFFDYNSYLVRTYGNDYMTPVKYPSHTDYSKVKIERCIND